MSEKYMNKITLEYIVNLLKNCQKSSKEIKEICIYLYEDCPYYFFKRSMDCPDAAKHPKYHIEKLEKQIDKWRLAKPSKEILRIQMLSESLSLNPIETAIIQFSYVLNRDNFLYRLISKLTGDTICKTPSSFLSDILSLPKKTLERDCFQKNTIFDMGLVTLEWRRAGYMEDLLILPGDVFHWIESSFEPDILSAFVGKPAETSLKEDDFSYVSKQAKFAHGILKGALDKKQSGINILIYGEPGTGKTEFCKMLGNSLGANLYCVGESTHNNEHGEISRQERLHKLNLANFLLNEKENSLILFDEMEDLIYSRFGAVKESKIFMNRLLEKNSVPTLWISNSIEDFDPAFLRRMSFVFELKAPPLHARVMTWQKIIDQHQIVLNIDEIKALAKHFDDPPALTLNAIKAAKMMGGTKEDITYALNGMRKAMGRPVVVNKDSSGSEYDPMLNNTNVDLDYLTAQLCNSSKKLNFSLCLYGPSGTGKSAYGRYLAEKLGVEVKHIRASNLISPLVGATERNIACAFQEAQEEKSFLIFDEADSFLQEREGARHSWEITAVNEMLTWMESHPYPFVCTTNLMDRIDKAALRRFTFKIEFDFMQNEQAENAFRHFFKAKAPCGLNQLSYLTPGDFAVVRKKASILDIAENLDILLNMLKEENNSKNMQPNPIGFIA